MSDRVPHAEALIARLAIELRPIRRLPPAWRRATLWLGASAWLTAVLAIFADFPAMALRLGSAPDMWLASSATVATAVLAAIAAHVTSIPGRSPGWAALPLPALLVWGSASVAGVMRGVPIPGTRSEPIMHPMVCFYFIVLASAPLAALLLAQVTRACPLRPRLTGALAGLASAASAVFLLTMIHPFDANAPDLLTHFTAVALVVAVVQWVGGRRALAPS